MQRVLLFITGAQGGKSLLHKSWSTNFNHSAYGKSEVKMAEYVLSIITSLAWKPRAHES